jgi:hypothetical protein
MPNSSRSANQRPALLAHSLATSRALPRSHDRPQRATPSPVQRRRGAQPFRARDDRLAVRDWDADGRECGQATESGMRPTGRWAVARGPGESGTERRHCRTDRTNGQRHIGVETLCVLFCPHQQHRRSRRPFPLRPGGDGRTWRTTARGPQARVAGNSEWRLEDEVRHCLTADSTRLDECGWGMAHERMWASGNSRRQIAAGGICAPIAENGGHRARITVRSARAHVAGNGGGPQRLLARTGNGGPRRTTVGG